MKIAYIISAYKLPEQLIRLVHRLNTPAANFFIHVDKKSGDRIYAQLVEALGRLANVTFLARHACYWGDFGHVRATIKGINEIMGRHPPFDFAVLLTGQDYPIKSNEYIHAFLRKNRGTSFIDYAPLPSDSWQPDGGLSRIQDWHIRIGDHKFVFPPGNGPSTAAPSSRAGFHSFFPKRKFPAGYRPFGGSPYWCLPRAAIEYIDEFVQKQRAFVRFFKYVEVPDEIFFHTILLNSPLQERVINDHIHYIAWKDPEAASPSILDESDFDQLLASPKLFARKFDVTVYPGILDRIDQEMLGERISAGV